MNAIRHGVAAALAVGAIALAVGACEDGGYGYGQTGGPAVACGQFSSCDTCTPIQGCGWCYTGNGTGTCTDGPQDCSVEPGGGWTWDPGGCRVGAEAGTSGPGLDAAAHDAPSDAPEDAASEAGRASGANGDGASPTP